MPPLPVMSGMEARRRFEAAGWEFKRWSGSHMMLTKPLLRMTLAVPNHRELAAGTLRGLIRKAGLTVEEFEAL